MLEVKKELDDYRVAIVYMTYELGTGRIAFANNEMETARKHFQNALDAGNGGLPGVANLGQTRRFRTAARTSLGDVALREGRYKDAAKMFADAASGAQKDNRLDLMWPAKRGLGRSLWMQAGLDSKTTESSATTLWLHIAKRSRRSKLFAPAVCARTNRVRRFWRPPKTSMTKRPARLPRWLCWRSPSGGALSGKALDYAAESFRITEAGRARSLLDMLGEVNAQITEGVPADLLKRKQDNLDRQQEIAQQLTGVSLAADQKEKPSQMDADLDKLQTEFDDIENQIRTASPRYAALTGAQPQTLADVQQKVLDDGTVLLEYSLGNDSSYLFAVSRTSVALFKLAPRADLDKLATDFRAQLIPPKLQRRIVGIDVVADQQRGLGLAQGPAENLGAFMSASIGLYQAAVAPASALLGDKRLLVVADGALNYVPFEALIKTSDGADYASLSYLIKTNEIVYAPSASVVAAIRQQRGSAGKNALVVADPVFNTDDPRFKAGGGVQAAGEARGLGLGLESAINDVTDSPAPAGGLRLARLVGTRTEAEEIGKIAKTGGVQTDLWIDLNASEDNVRSRDMNNYRVIHIATMACSMPSGRSSPASCFLWWATSRTMVFCARTRFSICG